MNKNLISILALAFIIASINVIIFYDKNKIASIFLLCSVILLNWDNIKDILLHTILRYPRLKVEILNLRTLEISNLIVIRVTNVSNTVMYDVQACCQNQKFIKNPTGFAASPEVMYIKYVPYLCLNLEFKDGKHNKSSSFKLGKGQTREIVFSRNTFPPNTDEEFIDFILKNDTEFFVSYGYGPEYTRQEEVESWKEYKNDWKEYAGNR